jgi:hypothetical protein
VILKGLGAKTNGLAVNRQSRSNSDSDSDSDSCLKGDPISKQFNGLGRNKNLVMGPDDTQNKEELCWRGPAAIYLYAMQCYISKG